MPVKNYNLIKIFLAIIILWLMGLSLYLYKHSLHDFSSMPSATMMDAVTPKTIAKTIAKRLNYGSETEQTQAISDIVHYAVSSPPAIDEKIAHDIAKRINYGAEGDQIKAIQELANYSMPTAPAMDEKTAREIAKRINFGSETDQIRAIFAIAGYTDIESKLKSQDDRITDIDAMINLITGLSNRVQTLEQIQFSQTGYFTPTDTKYRTIHTNLGNFMVSLDDVVKYAGGYKLSFNIGNPNFASYTNVNIKLHWNTTLNPNTKDWVKTMRSKEDTILSPLLPGSWNKVTEIISPATEKEIGFISLELEPNILELQNPKTQ